jgi:hypothetical protein
VIRAFQVDGQWFSTLARNGHIVSNAGPFQTEDKALAFFADIPSRYCATAVNKAIAASNRAGRRIGKNEAAAIHRLLKGRS